MIFRRYNTIKSNKSAEEVRKSINGQHLKVHTLDFEVSVREGEIKIIPHAEDEEHIFTLPITRVRVMENGNQGSIIKMMSKPRRIDIGGPYLILIFSAFAFLAAVLIFIFGEGKLNNTMYILTGIAVLLFAILWFRLEKGYFDYIRKIKKWVQDHV